MNCAREEEYSFNLSNYAKDSIEHCILLQFLDFDQH